MEKRFFVDKNASDVRLGQCFVKKQSNKSPFRSSLAYSSRTLRNAKRNYSTTDKEGVAFIWVVKLFKPYIEGGKNYYNYGS